MKTIGLIGGMSWESTASYYAIINREVNRHLKGLHSAKIAMVSVDFHDIEYLQSIGDWEQSAQILCESAQTLEQAGADFVVLCTNTMHKVASQIQASITCPLLHIAEATAEAIKDQGLTKVALLGTKYTMNEPFYKEVIEAAGIQVIVPSIKEMEVINKIIYDELCLGQINTSSKQTYLTIIDRLANKGAEGIILGCTEIGLLIQQDMVEIPLFDTAIIHAQAAAQLACI